MPLNPFQKEVISIEKLFNTSYAYKFLPEEIHVYHNLNYNKKAQFDIIINSYNTPELTSITVENYILQENVDDINIIVVESSGKKSVIEKFKFPDTNNISIIAIEEYNINWLHHGTGSAGMAISSSIGQYYSIAPYIFFSHSDMISFKKNFLNYLLEASGKCRIASFINRGLIPFTGSMLISKDVLSGPVDWFMQEKNVFIEESQFIYKINKLCEKHDINLAWDWIDCGESYIYNELKENKQVYVTATYGSSKSIHDSAFKRIDPLMNEFNKLNKNSGDLIIHEETNMTGELFKRKYPELIDAVKGFESLSWYLKDKRIYWGYSFDVNDDLLFIHHSRGTTRGHIKRWLKFTKEFNKKLRLS